MRAYTDNKALIAEDEESLKVLIRILENTTIQGNKQKQNMRQIYENRWKNQYWNEGSMGGDVSMYKEV